jgi:GrpB-like predicted nucleotidyltransferase (UPF0157 family)
MRRRGLSRFDVHIVERDGQLWNDAIFFRDFMRRHPADAHRWGITKREAARRGGSSYMRYAEVRREAISDLTLRARAALAGGNS